MFSQFYMLHYRRNYRKTLNRAFSLSLAFFLVLNIHLPALCAMQSRIDTKAQAEAETSLLLKGEVQRDQNCELEKKVNELMDTAVERDSDSEFLRSKNSHFNKMISRVWAGARDIAELASEYKGFEQSSEAGDVILGEKLKVKNRASATYAKQIKRDRLETETFLALMLMAEGLGNSDAGKRDELISKSISSLECLVGKDEAQSTLNLMRGTIGITNTDAILSARKPWNSFETAQETKTVLTKAMDGDEIVSNIKTVVHKKYNQRSAMARFCAKILNASLSIAGATPCIIGTASQCAWTLYIATQGGPEEAKLLKEVYLAKGLESRYRCLSEYATLAVNSHNLAIATQNPTMLSFSDWMISRVCVSDAASKLAASKLVANDSDSASYLELDSASASALITGSDTKIAAVSATLNH